MVIGLDAALYLVGEIMFDAATGQPIAAQAGSIIIGIIDKADRRRIGGAETVGRDHHAGVAAVGTDKGDAHGGRPIIGDIVKERTETTQHFLVEILVIAFLAVAEVQESAKAGRGGRIGGDLGVDLSRALRTRALPLVGTDVRAADVGRHAADITGVERAINAERVAVAIGRVAGNAQFLLRRATEEFDGAAQVGGGGGAERAGALADAGGADIVGDDGAADVKAVGVAIAHVAQRHAIQREAELVLVKTAQRDAGRPFIDAERIGRLEIDARQLLDGDKRAPARNGQLDVIGLDLGDLTHFTLAVHDDLGIFDHGISTGGLSSLGSGGDNDGLGKHRPGEGGAGEKGETVERTAHDLGFPVVDCRAARDR